VYTRGVIDALGLRHGPTHAEVMLTADGPCLVEMNCRAHGADGTWASLARALTGGFSQVDATADAFLDHSAFARLPSVYNELGDFKAAGQLVQLVSCYDGIIASLAPLGAIRALDSFQYMQVAEAVAPGKMLEKTVDLFTGIGFVILCHADPASVERDVATIRKMEKEGPLVELLEASSSEDEDAVAVHQSDRALDDALATVDLTKRLSRNSASSPTGVAAEGSGCVPVGIGA